MRCWKFSPNITLFATFAFEINLFSLQTIFISRHLEAESPFLIALSRYDLRVSGHSLIRFKAVPFDEIPATDWIFFYSRKAVAFFFRRVKELEQPPATSIRWGAIGPSTAAALEHWGVTADFVGDGDPGVTAQQFLLRAKGRRVLFPRAAQSRRSVEKALAGQIKSLDLVVYENAIDEEAPRPEADLLVFTSPLNARAYFEGRQPNEQTKVIAIGNTTAAALRELGAVDVVVAPEPSEAGLAQAVLSLV